MRPRRARKRYAKPTKPGETRRIIFWYRHRAQGYRFSLCLEQVRCVLATRDYVEVMHESQADNDKDTTFFPCMRRVLARRFTEKIRKLGVDHAAILLRRRHYSTGGLDKLFVLSKTRHSLARRAGAATINPEPAGERQAADAAERGRINLGATAINREPAGER